MKELIHAPLLKLVACFVLGILLAHYGLGWLAWVALPAALWHLRTLRTTGRQLSRRQEYGLALGLYLMALGLGALRQVTVPAGPGADGLAAYNCQPVALAGVVSAPVKETAYGHKTWLDAFAADSGAGWAVAPGRVLLYLPAGPDSLPAEGDSLFVTLDLRDVYSRYPGYLAYLHQHDIYYSGQVQAYQRGGRAFRLVYVARDWQQRLARQLDGLMGQPEAAAVARAMFLGDKNALDPEIRAGFAAAGLSHILAISGLHVGIIFLCLGFLTRPLRALPMGHRLQQGVLLLALLVYMAVTGASPAVVRAVLMFGTIILFRITNYRYHMLNLVAISAWLQLLHTPSIIFDIGFQLSYAAVLGIVGLLPRFEALVATPFSWLNKAYGAIGVTLVATLATLPLVLYHFGQFPTYFLLANVLVSAFAFVLVLTGFLTVCLSWVPGLNALLGQLCTFELEVLLYIVREVTTLPSPVIQLGTWPGQGLLMVGLQLALAALFMLLPRLRLPRRSLRPAAAWMAPASS